MTWWWVARAKSDVKLCRWCLTVVRVTTAATKHWQDRSHLVWVESQFEQTTQPRASYPDQLRDHHPTSVVRDLGVQLDSELSMKQHIRKVATCFFHLCHLRQIRRRVGQELTLHLVLAYVIKRLDYCNSLLAGLPLSSFEPLQRVQNAAARL